MSTIQIAKESLPNFRAGSGTVGTTEDKISAVNFPVSKHIVIRAAIGNSGVVMVGPPRAADGGFILAAGDTSPPLYVSETDMVRIVGSAAGQAYSWLAN